MLVFLKTWQATKCSERITPITGAPEPVPRPLLLTKMPREFYARDWQVLICSSRAATANNELTRYERRWDNISMVCTAWICLSQATMPSSPPWCTRIQQWAHQNASCVFGAVKPILLGYKPVISCQLRVACFEGNIKWDVLSSIAVCVNMVCTCNEEFILDFTTKIGIALRYTVKFISSYQADNKLSSPVEVNIIGVHS